MRREATSSNISLRLVGTSAGRALISWKGDDREKLCKVGTRKEALIVPSERVESYPPLLLISANGTPANFLIILRSMARSGATYVVNSPSRFQGTRI